MTYQGKEVFTSDDFDYAAAKPGDYVEEAVVDAAMNCLPPICMSSACAQMGDPYGTVSYTHLTLPTTCDV